VPGRFYAAAATRVIPVYRPPARGLPAARISKSFTHGDGDSDEDAATGASTTSFPGISHRQGSWRPKSVAAIAPLARDEIVLAKTCLRLQLDQSRLSSCRNIDIEDVFVNGFLTDQCIDHAIRTGRIAATT